MSGFITRMLRSAQKKHAQQDLLNILDARIESLGGTRTYYSPEKVEQRRLDALKEAWRTAGPTAGSFEDFVRQQEDN